MKNRYRVFVLVGINPGCTAERAGLPPDILDRVFQKEVVAGSKTEAHELAMAQIRPMIEVPGSNPEAFNYILRAVRLTPGVPMEPDSAQDTVPHHVHCPGCGGLGFIVEIHQEFVLHRCTRCNWFTTDDEFFGYVYFKLTGRTLANPTGANDGSQGQAG